MTKRDKIAPAIGVKTQHGVRPLGPIDAEQMWADPMGTEYDMIVRTKRSWPQLKLYWAMLNRVVKATGKWPTAEHLSDEIKLTLGYRRRLADLRTGEITESVDSIALDKMKHADFMVYFEASQQLLAEVLHMDPMAFMSQRDAA